MVTDKLRILLGGLLLPGLVCVAAIAQDDDDETERQKQAATEYVEVEASGLPESNTIATRLPVPLQTTPWNIGTVGPALFKEQGGQVLSDALRNVSGVNVQTQSGVHDFFVVRGFDSLSGSLVLIDGASEPEATYYPLYNVAGIEVLKGTGGFLYGKDPLAATVNIVRKQPLPTDLFGFSLSGGSFNTYEGALDWNTSSGSGNLDLRVNAFWSQTDNYRDLDSSQHWAVNPSVTWRPSPRSKLNLNLEYVDAQYSPDAGLPIYNEAIAPVSRRQTYHTPLDFSDQTVSRIQLDYEIKLSDRVTLRNKTYYRDLDWQSTGTLLSGALDVDFGGFLVPLVIRSVTFLDNRQTFTGNRFEAIFTLGGGSVTHHLLTGLEIARQEDVTDLGVALPCGPLGPPGCVPQVTLFDPMEIGTTIAPSFSLLTGDSRADIIAPYVIDQIRFSERYHLLIGVRWDDISLSGISRDDSELSPMAGFVFAPSDQLSLYVNAGQSHAPPGARVTDPVRVPEESTQYEVGVKKKFLDGKMQTTFSLYEIERKNIAIPDDTGILQQAGDQRSRGFEFELAAEPRSGFHTVFSYAYNDAELTRFSESVFTGMGFTTVDRTGNTPAFAPEHLANFWATKRLRGGLGFGGGLRYVDDQFIAEDNAFSVDSAFIVDATVFYDFGAWRAKLNLKNLTDEEYAIRGFGSQSVIPAAAFGGYLGIEYRR